MRTLYIVLICIYLFGASSTTANAQNVTLDQVIALRTKSLGGAEEFLTAKNWQLTNASEETSTTMGVASFAYEKNSYDDKAISFITYYYSSFSKRVNIQISATTTYNSYTARLKELGFKLHSSKVEDGSIVKIYKSKTLTIKVSTNTQKDSWGTKTSYHFFICSAEDYALQFESSIY